jgi:hypothetical protein
VSKPSGRQLFVYWKVDAPSADAALAAAATMQAALKTQHPQLQTGLFRRAEEGQTRATLMEVYAAPGGVGAELQAAIETAASSLTLYQSGARHVEAFEAV